MESRSTPAVVIDNLTKSFRKTALKKDSTTLKTEFLRILKGQRRIIQPSTQIHALRGIHLRIPKGKTFAIIGRNGSGKSTLLKLMTGIYTPTSGTIAMNGRISALLELGAGFHPDFTGRENILINGIILGMSRAEVKERAGKIIEFAEVGDFIDEPVRTYSSGMFMRLAFAVATHVDPEILIIDEILAVGDEHFQRKSQAKMDEFRTSGKTIIVVTHDLSKVESWCDEAAWIDGGLIRMVGSPRDLVAEYKRAVSAAEHESLVHGHSALNEPGAALPKVSGHELGDLKSPGVEIAQVELVESRDVSPMDAARRCWLVAPHSRVELRATWRVADVAQAMIRLQILAADGTLLFQSQSDAFSTHTPRAVRLVLTRLGLGEGTYRLALSAHDAIAPDDQPTGDRQVEVELKVKSNGRSHGLLSMDHSWAIDVEPHAHAAV